MAISIGSTIKTMSGKRKVVKLDIETADTFYYVSRESSDRFSVKPYVMHTALYYALGILPSRFRCEEQIPFYDEDKKEIRDLYIHPAISKKIRGYQTRRFAVKGDSYRTRSERMNRNLMETGYQKSMLPASTFRTYMVSKGGVKITNLLEESPFYVRLGKKMTSARVQLVDLGRFEVEEGEFKLSQPVSTKDLDFDDEYALLSNLRWERMNPVDLLIEGKLSGPHISFTVSRGEGEESLELPADAKFLSY